MSIRDEVISMDSLYVSMLKCKNNVGHKASVQSFVMNGMKNILMLNEELENDTYKPKKTNKVRIYYPKPRIAVANAFRDRVYQRSLNDVALYPQITKGFIKDNMACQKGKGTEKAIFRLQEMIHNEWRRNGDNVWILQGDIHHYYDTMQHPYADAVIQNSVDQWTAEKSEKVLHDQYSGDVGYSPGSQMVQIAGISYLNEFDHYAKDTEHIKSYIRYMDDIIIVHGSKEYLEGLKDRLAVKLAEIGLEWHPKKTKIVRAKDGIVFLGYKYRLANNGKVVMTTDPQKVKKNRVKLRRLVGKLQKGEVTIDDCNASVQCIIAHMAKGDCLNQIYNFLSYYIGLLKGVEMSPREDKLLQYAQMLAAQMVGEQIEKDAAINDYNIMMGNLEDPTEETENE